MQSNNRKIFIGSYSISYLLGIGISVFAVIFGGITYILFRPSDIIFFRWINSAVFVNWFNAIRSYTVVFGRLFPEWVVYSLPNGLWAFAYSLLIFTIWRKSNSKSKYFWFASIPILVFGFEILQYFEFIQGTFSIADLVAGLAGIFTGTTIKLLTKNI